MPTYAETDRALAGRVEIATRLAAELRGVSEPKAAEAAQSTASTLNEVRARLARINDQRRAGAISEDLLQKASVGALDAADRITKALMAGAEQLVKRRMGVQGQDEGIDVAECCMEMLAGADVEVDRVSGIGHRVSQHAGRRRSFLDYLRG